MPISYPQRWVADPAGGLKLLQSFRLLLLALEPGDLNASNFGSRRASEKCGLELEGTLRQELVSAGQLLDIWRIDMPRSRWSPAA